MLRGVQIYHRAGYQEFRDVHAARGAEFEAALTGLSYQLVRASGHDEPSVHATT